MLDVDWSSQHPRQTPVMKRAEELKMKRPTKLQSYLPTLGSQVEVFEKLILSHHPELMVESPELNLFLLWTARWSWPRKLFPVITSENLVARHNVILQSRDNSSSEALPHEMVLHNRTQLDQTCKGVQNRSLPIIPSNFCVRK